METSPNIQFNIKKVADEVSPEIKKIESEDEKIAKLSNDDRWVALKDRIERKIKAANDSTTLTQANLPEMLDSMQEYGFKCALRDLLVEAYQGVINDVEETFKILKAKKDEQGKEQ